VTNQKSDGSESISAKNTSPNQTPTTKKSGSKQTFQDGGLVEPNQNAFIDWADLGISSEFILPTEGENNLLGQSSGNFHKSQLELESTLLSKDAKPESIQKKVPSPAYSLSWEQSINPSLEAEIVRYVGELAWRVIQEVKPKSFYVFESILHLTTKTHLIQINVPEAKRSMFAPRKSLAEIQLNMYLEEDIVNRWFKIYEDIISDCCDE